MPSLFPHLRIHQVFGANTDVGKTVFTTVLCQASALLAGRQHSRVTQPRIFYLKPVSTGSDDDADDRHISQHTSKFPVQTHCLFKYKDPVSPHLAARSGNYQKVPSDRQFVEKIEDYIRMAAALATSEARRSTLFIETAGGVHSPTPSGSTQTVAYRPLRLPTVLVGDSNLGGISSTISAYESLLLHGYDVDTVLMFRDDVYRNHEYLESWFLERSNSSVGGSPIRVGVIPRPPTRNPNRQVDINGMRRYYSDLMPSLSGKSSEVENIVNHLDEVHCQRVENLRSMPARTLKSIWWPFVQHQLNRKEEDVTVIDSAHGDFFDTYRKQSQPASSSPVMTTTPPANQPSLLQPLYDGSASWWTQSIGHSEASLTYAAAYALGRYGHVIFPLATHDPALTLAERLIEAGPGRGWASKAFFSDNGSTGMEVALKMALKATRVRYGAGESQSELEILGLKGSYHGDTIGAMDACEGGVYNQAVEWYRPRGYWFEVPTVGIREGRSLVSGSGNGWKAEWALDGTFSWQLESSMGLRWNRDFGSLGEIYDVIGRKDTALAAYYRKYVRHTLEALTSQGRTFGALVVEPLVMGAAGMLSVDPLFQHILIEETRSSENLFASTFRSRNVATQNDGTWKGLPIIFDEVFSGLYRLGVQTSATLLHTTPDISVLAKILTGGTLPLSVTLASQPIFEAFLGDQKVDALLHGHSYTAHATGCAVANESLNILERMRESGLWNEARSRWSGTSIDLKPGAQPEVWSFWDPTIVHQLSMLAKVEEVMAMGTVLTFRLKEQGPDSGGYRSSSMQNLLEPTQFSGYQSPGSSSNDFGIHFRTLGDVGYLMCSLNSPPDVLRAVEQKVVDALSR